MSSIEERVREAEGRLFARYDVSVIEHLLDLKVAGDPLRIRVLETGSGPPVLLLHPASWFGAMWAPLIPHLPGRRVLCVDQPGHGLSGGVDYRKHNSRDHMVAVLGQVLSGLGLGAVPVVGNSLGGMSALWLAVAQPRLVSQLVIFGVPAIALPEAKLDLALRLITIPGLNRLLLRLPSSPGGSRRLSRPAFGRAAWDRAPRELFEIHYQTGRRPELALSLSTMLQSGTRWFAPRPQIVLNDAEIAGLEMPVRFLWGDRDIYGPPAMAERAAALMPDAALTVIPGGHFPQCDDPEASGKFVSEFLGQLSS